MHDVGKVWALFTISFYWKTDGKGAKGILYVDEEIEKCQYEMSIYSKGLNLMIVSTDSKCNPLHHYEIENVFTPNQFTFVAITYNRIEKILEIFNDHGQVISKHEQAIVQFATPREIRLGYAVDQPQTFTSIHNSNAISCLNMYGGILTSSEIASLPCACQIQELHLAF